MSAITPAAGCGLVERKAASCKACQERAITHLDYFCIRFAMSNEEDKRNNELTRKTNERPPEPFNKQNPNEPVEVAEKNLENVQDNQKRAARENNPHSETGPAENLRAKAAKAEDKSQGSREPA